MKQIAENSVDREYRKSKKILTAIRGVVWGWGGFFGGVGGVGSGGGVEGWLW